MNEKRLFIAIKVPENPLIVGLSDNLKTCLAKDKINWVKTSNLHLTFKFLGNTSVSKIPEILSAIEETTKLYEKFTASIDEIGIFGSKYNPKVMWVKANPEKRFNQIFETLSQHLSQIGISKTSENFVPHVTLARIKHIQDVKYFQSCISKYKHSISFDFLVENMILFESRLTPKGAEYSVVNKLEFI